MREIILITAIVLDIALIIALVVRANVKAYDDKVIIIPPMPAMSPVDSAAVADEIEWDEFWSESFADHSAAFDALFESYEVKQARNGAMMIRSGGSGSFKFARKS